MVRIETPWSSAEIYLNGAQITGFQKRNEAPLLFLSAKSFFKAGEPIRGGIPICYPWFGPREGDAAHGFVRTAEWELVESTVANDGAVTVRFRLPELRGRETWNLLRTEFAVTVAESLTMELTANNSSEEAIELENCLHTYFQVGDIAQVSIDGLQSSPFLDFASGATGEQKVENDPALLIAKETNRVYPDSTATVEITDRQLKRTIRVEKSQSKSTVVWNPWTTQKLPNDFDQAEHRQMICVESGNVKQNRISLAPGESTALKVILTSSPNI